MEFMLQSGTLATQSADSLCSLETNWKKKQKIKEADRVSMSDRIPWRFFSFVIEMIALTSPRKTGRIQTLVCLRWIVWDRAERIANLSTRRGDFTQDCAWKPCCEGAFGTVKIQPSHVSFVDGFQAASVLHSTVPVGIEGISGCIGALIWSYIPYMMHFRQRPSRRGGGSVTSVWGVGSGDPIIFKKCMLFQK